MSISPIVRLASVSLLLLTTPSACKSERNTADGAKDGGALRAKATPRDSNASGPGKAVGEPCLTDGECGTGECIKEAAFSAWTGGYCSLTHCETNCPSGSQCSGGGAIHTRGCFRECVLGKPCRDGYRCCPGQSDAGSSGLCVPATGTRLSCAK